MTSHPFPLLWKFKSVCAWNHFFLLFFHFRIFEILLYTSQTWKGELAEFCLMRKSAKSFVINTFRSTQQWSLIAELAERSPIIIQNGSSNPSSRKNLDIWPYDRTIVRPTVQGATFNMRGQLYRGHANATALSSSPVVSALGSELDDPGSSPGRGKALCPWDVRKKNMRAPLLGLAKSIYYYSFTNATDG